MITTAPTPALLTDLAIELESLPLEQLADYAAITYFLTIETTEAIAYSTPRPYLEAFYHLVQLEDWQRAIKIMLWSPDPTTQEELHHALGVWGNYGDQLEVYNSLLYRVNPQCDMTCLNGLAHYYDRIGDFQQAIALQKEHLQLAQNHQDLMGQWLALIGLGNAYDNLGDYEQTTLAFEQALQIAEKAGDIKGQVIGLGSLGNAYRLIGQPAQAEQAAHQSIRLAQKAELIGLESSGLLILGRAIIAQNDQNRYREVEAYYQRALTLAENLASRPAIAEALCSLGDLYNQLNEDERGLEILERGLTLAQDIGTTLIEGEILRAIGNLYFKNDHFEGAEYYFSQWFALAKSNGDRRSQQLALGGLSNIENQRDNLPQAIAYEKQRLDIARERQDIQAIADATAYLGYALMNLDADEIALSYLLEAVALQKSINDHEGLKITLANLAVLNQESMPE